MDQRYHSTTSLPPIDVMLNILPNCPPQYNTYNKHELLVSSSSLDDTTNRSNNSRPALGHRRHASEHIASSSSRLVALRDSETALRPLPPVPTSSLGTSTSSLTGDNSNSSGGSSISGFYSSTSSSPLSSTSCQDDKYNNNNTRTQQRNCRGKDNILLLSQHLPPPLQLMQPKFGFSTNTSFPSDMQALGVSSVSSHSSSSSSSSRLPNRRRTHSRSLSDYSYSSSSISHDNRRIELSQQSAFQALPPVIATASKKDQYCNSNNNNNNNHILSAATRNINNGNVTVRQPQLQQQLKYDSYVNNKVLHSQQHLQNSKDVHRAYNNDGINISQMNTATITTSAAGNRYICSYCKKRFSRPSSLRTHTYSHTGEKPFICTVEGCHRGFSVHSNLRRHLRVHKTTRSPDSLSIPTFTVSHGLCMSL